MRCHFKNAENFPPDRPVICVLFRGFLTWPDKSQIKPGVGSRRRRKSAPAAHNNNKNTHSACLPATLATLSASWLFAPLERLGLRCLAPPDAERMLRRCTSVGLKKATMKGCLF